MNAKMPRARRPRGRPSARPRIKGRGVESSESLLSLLLSFASSALEAGITDGSGVKVTTIVEASPAASVDADALVTGAGVDVVSSALDDLAVLASVLSAELGVDPGCEVLSAVLAEVLLSS